MNDKYNKRERRRYKNTIASREAILACLNSNKSGVSIEQLAKNCDKKSILARINAMIRDGQITCLKNKYHASDSEILAGYVIIRHDGFGLVRANAADYLLPPRQAMGLVRGDYIKFRTSTKLIKGKTIAILIAVLNRAKSKLIGEFQGQNVYLYPGQIGGRGLLKTSSTGYNKGQKVYVQIEEYPDNSYVGSVKVTSVLDEVDDMRVWAAILHGLPHEFSTDVLQAADQLKIASDDGRKDLRQLQFVTIDGATAQDFDDAIFVRNSEKGYVLYVAIADVSAYVAVDSPLDQEALLRATSVYFPGQVIPMLPEKISNDLCSLLPNCERAVMVAEMIIDSQGQRQGTKIYKALIKSHARFTYTEVAGFANNQSLAPDFWQETLHELKAMCAILNIKKKQRGALTIARSEQVILLDKDGSVANIENTTANIAHSWIELCMLEANEAVAEFMIKHNLSGIYREHGQPKPDKFQELCHTLKNFGVTVKNTKNPGVHEFQAIIDEIEAKGLPEPILILMLRALPQASYTEKQLSHFGLAYKNYCHFTSPIRRYPDLWVHRQISNFLSGKSVKQQSAAMLAQHCSFAERRADQASRDVTKKYICQFMQSKIGEVVNGTIATVLDFGFFVAVDSYGVEGLVHISNLGDEKFTYDSDLQALIGQLSGDSYTIGDSVVVKISRVVLDSGQIDFKIIKK